MSRVYKSIWIPLPLVALMVAVFFAGNYFEFDMRLLANFPRSVSGLAGILFAPLVHINTYHLLANVFPILCLGTAIYWFYPKVALPVLIRSYLVPMILVWLFARPTYHAGASGMVYALAFFLILFGFFRKDFKSLSISIIILIFFGGLFHGILPQQPEISFESHLAGAVSGAMSAFEFSKVRTSNSSNE